MFCLCLYAEQDMERHSSTLANYNIGTTIHTGPSWKVKIATNSVTAEKVAIKIIRRDQMMSAGMEDKVNEEIKILRSFTCSNVVKLYEVIETSEAVYIATEYCENGELFDYVVSKGRLQEDEARRIFHQIICGVEYCHRNMVIHCDLRPENLLLDSEFNVKLANFEYSNVMQDGKFLNTNGGSTNYAAPEVICGESRIGCEVDVWSCGVVLYALLCGSLPFDAERTVTLHKNIIDGAYTLPSHLSASARDLIAGMLVADPKSRITMSEVGRHPWFSVSG